MEYFVTRRAIFDGHEKLKGYELLFRRMSANGNDNHDEYGTSQLFNYLLANGFETVTRGKIALVNFTKKLLLDEVPTLFPRELITVGILQNVTAEDKIVTVLHKLKQAGYQLAFDSLILSAGYEPFVELADIISVDFLSASPADREGVIDNFRSRPFRFLAKNVRTREEFNRAKEQGYSLCHGSFFSNPDPESVQDISGFKLNFAKILRELGQAEINFDRLSEILEKDVGLSYKLLTYVNSAHFGLPNKIKSIRHALSLLGRREAKKFLTILALSSSGKNNSEELMVTSITKASFCQLVANQIGLEERASELFIMGLFSHLDALLDQPMADILPKLPVSDDIKSALIGEANQLHDVLELYQGFEIGAWQQMFDYGTKLGVEEDKLPELFRLALEESNKFSACIPE